MPKVKTVGRDKKTGRFIRLWHLSTKGYPRFHTKERRNQYVHIVKWTEEYGHALTKDQDLHHRNGNKLDWREENLLVTGHREHGWVTRLQAYYMKHIKGPREEREWDEYFGDGAHALVDEQGY